MRKRTDATLEPDDGRFYFPATPPMPGRNEVVWTMGLDVALPHAEFVALVEVDRVNHRARRWGTVPFNALLEQADGHVAGIASGRFYLHKEGWPSLQWISANRID